MNISVFLHIGLLVESVEKILNILNAKLSEFGNAKKMSETYRLPQKLQGYGRVSECMSKCVDNVLERLNAFPHCLHSKTFSTL